MKIAFLSYYKGIVPRGVETFVDELASRLSKNHEVTVFQSCQEDKKSYKIEIVKFNTNNLKDTEKSILRKFFLDHLSLKIALFTIKCIPRLLKNKYDIVIPTNGGWQTPICKIICLVTRSKLVISGQSGKGFDDRWNLLWSPSVFVALSIRDELWAKKYLKNVIKIPNGVDLNKFNSNVTPAQVPLKKPIVLCVSALTSQKRIPLSIHAIATTDKFNLLVIGQGSDEQKEKINSLGKSLLGNRFLLIEVPHNKIAPYYKAADVFTLPSASSEAFGIVLVEAMATNLPVVATDDEVRKEIIGDAGIFINPENIDEYSAALKKALETNWGNKPRLQAQKYSWDSIANDYEKAFEKLC